MPLRIIPGATFAHARPSARASGRRDFHAKQRPRRTAHRWLCTEQPEENHRTRSERNMDAKTDDKSAGKCPFTGGHANRDWWPDAPEHRGAPSGTPPLSDPMGEAFDYAKEFKSLDLERRDQGPACPDDELAGVVAGRLRPLRRTVHPHGLAQRRAPTASPTAAAAPAPASSASRRSTAGRTTRTSTRRAACCGRSSRSTAAKSPGPT